MRTPSPVNSEWWRPDVALHQGDRGGARTTAQPQDSGSAIAYWAMMAFTFILFIAPQTLVPSLVPFRIALLTAVFAITTYVFDKLASGKPLMMRTREVGIAAGLIAWSIVTVPFSLRPGESLSVLLETYGKTLAVFWLLSHTVTTLARLRQVAWAVTLMTVPMAVTAIRHYMSGTFIPGTNRILGYDAPMTGDPNGLALVLNMILPLSVALLLFSRKPVIRMSLLVIIFLDVVAVILTLSRGGFVTLALIFGVYVWKLLRRSQTGWVLAGLALTLACLLVLPSGYLDRLATISDMKSDATGSAQDRWRDMVAAVNVALHNPIVGVGLGMNGLALTEERGPTWSYKNGELMLVHNVYLVYAAELGLPGLVLFLMFLAGCMRESMAAQVRSSGVPALQELSYLAEGIQVSLIAFAVGALFDPNAYQFHCYYVAGLAVAVGAVSQSAAMKEAEPSPPMSQTPSSTESLPEYSARAFARV